MSDAFASVGGPNGGGLRAAGRREDALLAEAQWAAVRGGVIDLAHGGVGPDDVDIAEPVVAEARGEAVDAGGKRAAFYPHPTPRIGPYPGRAHPGPCPRRAHAGADLPRADATPP